MTSEGRALLGDGGDRCSPLPSHAAECGLTFTDSGAASGEGTGSPGLVFVARRESSGDTERSSAQEGGVTLDSPTNPKLDEAWGGVERVMAARQWSVTEVMEEFGVADAPPVADQLEDQLWSVVERKLTLTEAADLV